MGSRSPKRFYAFDSEGEQGILDSWPECEARVSGRKSRYRGFATRAEAEAWLAGGARYENKAARKSEARMDLPQDALYFDAGTGRGLGVEVNVTDRAGVPMVHLARPKFPLTEHGTVRLPPDKTNNFGELLGCLYALRIAKALGRKAILGDSALVLDFWSKDRISADKRATDPDLTLLARHTAMERASFEAAGGSMRHVSGSINPADLGFHRD